MGNYQFWRDANGIARMNVPHIVHHSPDGIEFGYGGSGPADAALSVLEAHLKAIGYTGARQACYRGDCYSLAWRLHQDFKFHFIGRLPRATGGILSAAAVDDWLRANLPEGETLPRVFVPPTPPESELIYHDPNFEFPGWHKGSSGRCDLKVYRKVAGKHEQIVVVAAELIGHDGEYASDGLSVTNGIERIATKVRTELGFVFDSFIEHYPLRGMAKRARNAGRTYRDPLLDEQFALVTFSWNSEQHRSPSWKRLTRAEAVAIIGQDYAYDYR